MQIHFYAEKKTSGRYTVHLKCYIEGKPVKYFPKIQCEGWDPKNERATGFNKANINALLTNLKLKGLQIEHDLKRSGKLNKDNFLRELSDKPSYGNFFDEMDKFILESTTAKAHGTIKQYKAVRNNLLLFHEKHPFTFDSIDIAFYTKLLSFYINDCGMNNNTAGHQIQKLKAFLNHLIKKGYTFKFSLRDFKVLREQKQIIYHSQQELEILYTMEIPQELKEYQPLWHKLYKRDFPGKDTLEIARDIHILECQTSLRVSDRKRLGAEHIKGNIIKMPAHKNKKTLTIPLTPKARGILEKYNYELPAFTDVRMNEYVKALCLIAGFDYLIEDVDYKGGQKIYTKVPKWQLITNHTAVKTFISHCVEKGISPKVVSEITGKTVKVIMDHYYGTSDKVIQMEMEKAFGVTTVLKAI